MNSKTGVQIIAAFLVLTMVLSIFPMFFSSSNSNTRDNTQATPGTNDLQNDYFNVEGQQIARSLNSVTEGLQMSTPDAFAAQFIDMEYINSTSYLWYEQLPLNLTTVRTLRKSEVDNIYQTSAEQAYFAQLPDNDFILLSTMTPKLVTFQYIGLPSEAGPYLILTRSDTGGTNVMGEPTVYTNSRDNAEAVISIIESWTPPLTAYDRFMPVLNFSDDNSEYQVVNSRVEFADLYYLGIHRNDDGSFTRTAIYLNPTQDTSSHIRSLAKDGIERGFSRYDVTTTGDVMKVVIGGEFQQLVNEDIK